MTGTSDMTNTPTVLIDEWMDGWVESTAWVEATVGIDAEAAVKLLEEHYPIEDREEEERYACDGETTWQCPDVENGWDGTEGPWKDCGPDDEGARRFFVVKVVCAA